MPRQKQQKSVHAKVSVGQEIHDVVLVGADLEKKTLATMKSLGAMVPRKLAKALDLDLLEVDALLKQLRQRGKVREGDGHMWEVTGPVTTQSSNAN